MDIRSKRAGRWTPPATEMEAMRSWRGLLKSGGVGRWEREAAAIAIKATRQTWLLVLETWQQEWYERFAHNQPAGTDFDEFVYVDGEIRRLRRALSIKPTPDQVREQTRRRVQAFRERQRRNRPGARNDFQGKAAT
jgi:hypothetical protein